jgi:hypothetical protein
LRFETRREFEEGAEQALNQLGADGWEVTGFVRFEIGRENGYRGDSEAAVLKPRKREPGDR